MSVLVKILPQFLLRLFVPVLLLCLAAWFVVLLVSAARGAPQTFGARPRAPGRFVWVGLIALAVACTLYSGKGPNGTNGVQNLPPRPMLQLPAPTPTPTPSIFDYPRTVTETRAASGFALVGVGTNETFAFDPPTNAIVCADWRMYGSASRWTHVSSTNFAFPFAGTNATTFTFVPGGVAELAGGADEPRVAPFDAKMGIAPERYWGSLGVTSRFWTATSSSNTFLATWQGALLGRRADSPVDVQLELFPDGGFDFRYGLSRLASDDALADARVAAWNAGGGETYSVPHRNVTSARWRPVAPVDALDPDRDGDGVTTVDELFFLGTDPGNPDSDFDGLSDGDEIAYGRSPLDPYSNGGPYADGFALKIGDLNPLVSPPDSPYTFYEHVLYSGSTNGMVSPPASTAAFALLEVAVSETGTGDLVVGMQSLPLVGGAPPVYLAVPRGTRRRVWLRRRAGALSVFLNSEDFAIGETPNAMDGDPSGWICFPRTEPSPAVACIHDLYGRKVGVRLVPGVGADGISCLWCPSDAVAVSNHADGVSATLTGNFDASRTESVWYVLSHPRYLFGVDLLQQSVRFCPRPSGGDDDPEDEPEDDPEEEPDPEDPNEDLYNHGDEDTSRGGCNCCGSCALGGGDGCGHHAGEAPPGVSGPVPTGPPDPEDPEAPPPDCPVHNCPYSECYELHEDNAPRTVTVPSSTHVLTIGRVPSVDTVSLAVPEGAVNCCPCPSHWTNYVGVAYKSGHLAVKDGGGLDFWRSETDGTVYVTGVWPTRAAAGTPLAFATNGAISVRRDYIVLGVDIDTPNGTASSLNTLNPLFGIPATVCTNASRASGIDLVTRVRLAAGAVTLAAGDGAFQAWLDRSHQGRPPLLLVDGTARPTVTLSLAKWRSLAGLTGDESEARTRILLTSATPGARTLTFSFTAGGALTDSVTQRITFVKPPLRLDITRDASIDDGDVVANLARKSFYFWTNEDFWKNDDAFDGEDPSSLNVSDLFVNGRNDLINLLPVAVDISPFIDAWGNSATFRIRGNSLVRYAIADIDWEYVDQMHIDDCLTTVGGAIRTALLTALSVEGATLGANEKSLSLASSLTLLLEAAQPCSDPVEIVAEVDGETLFSYRIPLTFSRVKTMYRWFNRRSAAGGEGTDEDRPWNPVGWPDADRDGGANGPMLVFVHGYNMAEWEARAWSDGVFKRLWWSGLNAKFAAVAWRGNEGQINVPSQGLVTPNYQVNVEHAFATAPALASLLNGLPGDKYVLAHSLGNMVVSSAIQDHGLQCKNYFMLNAAVPVEAYDVAEGVTAESKAGMTHPEWTNYPDRVRASHWWELFPVGDGRHALTWKGRFANVTNTVNYFSSEEEVLANGNGVVPTVGRAKSWFRQEVTKGIKSAPLITGRNEAGWEFNVAHMTEPVIIYPPPGSSGSPTVVEESRLLTPSETTNLTDAVLMDNPFFGHFQDHNIYSSSNGLIVATNTAYRTQLLADAIPAESFAAGANRVPAWGDEGEGKCNVNMIRFKDKDRFCHSSCQSWTHSLFLGAPYMCIHKFYENIVSRIPKETE